MMVQVFQILTVMPVRNQRQHEVVTVGRIVGSLEFGVHVPMGQKLVLSHVSEVMEIL